MKQKNSGDIPQQRKSNATQVDEGDRRRLSPEIDIYVRQWR